MDRTAGLSMVYPAHNDGGTIASMVIEALLIAQDLTNQYEVIVVNDGSQDHTCLLLDELAQQYPDHLRVIHHAYHKGYGNALRAGLAAATHELIAYTDANAQYDP